MQGNWVRIHGRPHNCVAERLCSILFSALDYCRKQRLPDIGCNTGIRGFGDSMVKWSGISNMRIDTEPEFG